MATSPHGHVASNDNPGSLDDAEKGMHDNTELATPLPFVYLSQERPPHLNTRLPDKSLNPFSPVHNGITPCTSVPELSLSFPQGRRASLLPTNADVLNTTEKKPTPSKPKIGRWILFILWFNVYRRFFTFIVLLNLTGIITAALGRFTYAENHTGALVLGNLLAAIMMRNELWIRFLYMVAIYGLRSVRTSPPMTRQLLTIVLVGP
jgi:hypothetical protein